MKKVVVEEIKNSKFLKNKTEKELINISTEIRKYIIESVSKTGGHLSSNLGIVDLTVALHKVFDFNKDKIIFDVGHQCYTHKILTGRKLETLRQFKGISGFQSLKEGDDYEAGHSSTSLSAAIGFAISRDLDKKNNSVIAIIGDGSIGNGVSYEALNHIGSLPNNIIVILNDNEMSITKNVGGLHNALDKIRSDMKYNKVKKTTKNIFGRVPIVGVKSVGLLTKIKKSFKRLYNNEGIIFEDLGFDYYGPINGHDYKELELYLNIAKKAKGPVLLHVITEKGKGYIHSENDLLGNWHGVGKFDIETGLGSKKGTIGADIASTYLYNMMKTDKSIIAITPAMMNGSKLTKIEADFKKQFIDVGIAEEHGMIVANALGLSNKKPYIFIYSSFLQRSYDQLIHDVAKMKSNVVICIDRCGVIGDDGSSHQGIYDISFMLPIPNLIIAHPKDSVELNSILKLSLDIKQPMAIRYSKNSYEETSLVSDIKLGSWETLKTGKDAVIISYGDFLTNALNIADRLKKDNIKVEVINARFIKPVDTAVLKRIENKKIFVYEEACKIGSLGSHLSTYTDIDIIAIDDYFVEHGSRDKVLKDLGLDEDTVYKYILKECKKVQ